MYFKARALRKDGPMQITVKDLLTVKLKKTQSFDENRKVSCHWPYLWSFGFYFILFCFLPFRAVPVAYVSFRARGWIRAIPAGLCHSHSNRGSNLCLQPTPQFMAVILNPLSEARDWTCIFMDTSRTHFLLGHNGNSVFFDLVFPLWKISISLLYRSHFELSTWYFYLSSFESP